MFLCIYAEHPLGCRLFQISELNGVLSGQTLQAVNKSAQIEARFRKCVEIFLPAIRIERKVRNRTSVASFMLLECCFSFRNTRNGRREPGKREARISSPLACQWGFSTIRTYACDRWTTEAGSGRTNLRVHQGTGTE